jgi:hypothetical protein
MSRSEFIGSLAVHGFQPLRSRYRGFFFSALWYRTFIYSPRVKAAAIGLIGDRKSLAQRVVRLAAYAAMHAYIGLDSMLSGAKGGMGIDAAFVKAPAQNEDGE